MDEAKKYILGANPAWTTNLANMENLVYMGNIYMGSQKQQLKLIFDTGSDWLVLLDKDCTNCVSTKFNSLNSTTFAVDSTTSKTLKYGSAQVTGYTGIDTTSLDSA